MFKIIQDGAVIAMTERPTHIKLLDNGCFGLCKEAEAQGIAHNGTPYHLLGRPELPGAETVMLEETDGGGAIVEMQTAIDDLTVATLMGGGGNV